MLEYFVDEAGEHRYRIKGGNGEPMATSEGYSTKSNATRGYWDLVNLIQAAHSAQGAHTSEEARQHRDSLGEEHQGSDTSTASDVEGDTSSTDQEGEVPEGS